LKCIPGFQTPATQILEGEKQMTAKNTKSIGRQILAVTCGIFLLGALVVGGSYFGAKDLTAHAQNDGSGFPCSNQTLKGRYGMKGEGLVPGGPPPAPLVPFAMVGIETLDGEGNLTDAATISLNGVVASNVNPGTYNVNEDCTGTYTVTISVPPFQISHRLVVVDKGKEFYLIGTQNSVLTFAAKRLD
jgi:hypothetical protein